MITPDSLTVRHETSAKRFAVRLNSKIGYLSYEMRDDKTLDYSHVYVPPEFRRQGIAAKITKTALFIIIGVIAVIIIAIAMIYYFYFYIQPNFDDPDYNYISSETSGTINPGDEITYNIHYLNNGFRYVTGLKIRVKIRVVFGVFSFHM